MRGNEKPRTSGNLGQGRFSNQSINSQYHTSKRPASTAIRFRPGKNDLNAVRKDWGADEPRAEYSTELAVASLVAPGTPAKREVCS